MGLKLRNKGKTLNQKLIKISHTLSTKYPISLYLAWSFVLECVTIKLGKDEDVVGMQFKDIEVMWLEKNLRMKGEV